jgi:hypothetical protein
MIFRDDFQRGRVCAVILGKTDLQELWTENGPTDHARRLLAQGVKGYSAEKRTLFLLAWEFWRTKTELKFHDLRFLSPKRLHLVGSLLMAMAKGPDSIDDWLAERS